MADSLFQMIANGVSDADKEKLLKEYKEKNAEVKQMAKTLRAFGISVRKARKPKTK